MEDKRDGDDAQSATSTGYHSQVRERERERERKRRERERGKKQIYFQIQILFKIKIKKPNHQARKSALRCRIPRMKYLFFIRSRDGGGEKDKVR